MGGFNKCEKCQGCVLSCEVSADGDAWLRQWLRFPYTMVRVQGRGRVSKAPHPLSVSGAPPSAREQDRPRLVNRGLGFCLVAPTPVRGAGTTVTGQTALCRTDAGVNSGSQARVNVCNFENKIKQQQQNPTRKVSAEQRLSPCDAAGWSAGGPLREERPWLEALL